jgi:hypothetical protein
MRALLQQSKDPIRQRVVQSAAILLSIEVFSCLHLTWLSKLARYARLRSDTLPKVLGIFVLKV